MDMRSCKIELNRFFYHDSNVTRILVEVRRIERSSMVFFTVSSFAPTISAIYNKLFEGAKRDRKRKREHLHQLLRIVLDNRNIHGVTILGVHIPGTMIAEWLDCNKFASEFDFYLSHDQSDMQLVCDALQRNTTIKTLTLRFNSVESRHLLPMLGNALQQNRGIVDIKINDVSPQWGVQLLLSKAFSRGNHIKSLTLENMFSRRDSSPDVPNCVKELLSENAGLNHFTLKTMSGIHENMFPILQGVINSAVTEFHFFSSGIWGPGLLIDQENAVQNQHDCMEMIGNMKSVRCFYFQIADFSHLSAEYICSTLKDMQSLDYLSIKQCDEDHLSLLQGVIQGISTWERPCKLKLDCQDSEDSLIELLKSVQLEAFDCNDKKINVDRFVQITNEIPSWFHLKELKIYVRGTVSQTQKSKFLAALSKSSSLNMISIKSFDDFSKWYTATNPCDIISIYDAVNRIVVRNKHLAESKINPIQVPLTQWPELFSLADETGLNFSYECIRKIPDIFVSMFRDGLLEQDQSSHCMEGSNSSKRELCKSGEQAVAVKRIRQCM